MAIAKTSSTECRFYSLDRIAPALSSFKKNIINFAKEISYSSMIVSGFLIASLAASIFFPPLAVPLFAIGASILISKLATKIITGYNHSIVDKIERKGWDFHQRYGRWRFIAFIVVIAVSYLIPLLGVFLCVGYGTYCGIVLEMDHCRTLADARRMRPTKEIFTGVL